MDNWLGQVSVQAKLLIEQLVAVRAAQQSAGKFTPWIEDDLRRRLEDLYSEDYASAKLRDRSDIVFRAEGPGATHDSPTLHSLNWLTDHVGTQLRHLQQAVIPLGPELAKAVAKQLDWAFTGYAPGSIMLGFALKRPVSQVGFEASDESAFGMLNQAAQSIAAVPEFVGETEVDAQIADKIPDPVLRDAAIVAAWKLSPTTRSGIHTIEVMARNGDRGSLSQRERLVLKQSVNRPVFRQEVHGSFEGELRAADLDKHRAVLRHVDGVGSIRCVLDARHAQSTQKMFGSRVKVTGKYEADQSGRPRMMRVEKIEPSVDLLGLVRPGEY